MNTVTHYLNIVSPDSGPINIGFSVRTDRVYVNWYILDTNEKHSDVASLDEAREIYRECLADGWVKGKYAEEKTACADAILGTLKHAVTQGVTNPRMVVEGFCFKLGKPGSANPGWVYVTESAEWGAEYYGKIDPTGKFNLAPGVSEDITAKLHAVSADVVAAAKAYGRKFGKCSFCSRTLTHGASIKLSYGPVCAEHYGLPHSYAEEDAA